MFLEETCAECEGSGTHLSPPMKEEEEKREEAERPTMGNESGSSGDRKGSVRQGVLRVQAGAGGGGGFGGGRGKGREREGVPFTLSSYSCPSSRESLPVDARKREEGGSARTSCGDLTKK